MKKVLLTIGLFSIVFLQVVHAQVNAYAFSSTSGTYTAITGGTVLLDGTASMDDWTSTAITIPSFTFNSVAYTTAYVTTNGLLTLGGTAPSNSTYTGLSSTAGSGISICPFSADLDKVNSDATSEMRWETVGNEIVFQWKQMKRYGATENFDFQIRLNTVTKVVSFVYQLNSGPGSATNRQPQVGIRTSATDYNNRLVASGTEDWATSLSGTSNTNACRFTSATPQKNFTSGLTYTWTPTTCFPPTSILVSNITATSANISWTAPTSGTPNSYEWKVVLSGAGSGGAAVSNGSVTHPTVSANASGLTSATAYDLYVRTYCGGSDYSNWVGPNAFTTLCLPTSVPYFEGFENITANNQLPACMSATSLGTKNLTYISSGTYNRIPKTGAKFASFQYAPADNWFFFAPVQLTAGVSYDAGVWYITDGATGFTALNLAYGNAQSSSAMTQIATVTNPANTAYQQLAGSFTPTASGVYYLGVQASGTSTNPWYLTIDDISLIQTPSCPAVNTLSASNITASTAILNWNESGTATTWNVQWGQTGFTLGSGTIIPAAAKPYPLSGLSPGTSYSFYVQSDCGSGLLSTWTGPFSFITSPSCPGVNTLSANTSATSAILNWNELGTATTWNVQWGQTGFTLGSGTIVPTTIKPYTLSPLTPNTSYSFYVQSNCGGVDTSAWTGPFTFTTPCLPSNVPYFESFENITANNQLPACMSATSLGTKNLTYISSGTYNRIPKTGAKFASFQYAPADNWFFFAPVQLTAGVSYDAGVWYITDGATGFTALNLAYGNAQNGTAMTQIGTVANPTNTTYQQLLATFTPTTTGVYYLGIQANGTSYNPWYLTIDDISLKLTPTCPGVTTASFTASNPTVNSIDLTWTEPGTATHWQIEYGTTGYTQGQGSHVIVSANPSTLSGLTPATSYQAYIRSICSPGDTSSWKGPIAFTTACLTVSTPFTEGFESPTAPPVCWTMWYANATPVAGNLMKHSTDEAYSGNQSFRFSSYSLGSPYEQFLETPLLNYTSNMELTFWYRSSSPYGTEVFAVGTSVDGTNWTWGANDSDATSTEWKQYILEIPSATKYVAIQYKSDYQYYLYIDDFSIHAIPTCPGVTAASFHASNPTLNSVDLTWTEPGTANKWQIEYGLNGFTQGTGSYAIVSAFPPYTLTGLQASKTYQAYIRSICSPGDTSTWKGPITFSTSCGVFSIPFTEDFTGTTVGNIPNCWSRNLSNWGVNNSNNAGGNAPEMRLNWSPGVTDTVVLITPLINATNASSLYLRFRHSVDYYSSLSNPYTLGVAVSEDGGFTWDSLWAVIPTASVTEQFININLSAYIGQSILVAWTFAGNTYDINYWYIDNVLIDEIPPCVVPSSLNAVNILPTSADLTWLSGGEAQWKIEWDTTNFVQGNGKIVVTSDNPFTLNGLTPETTYDFYVKAYCAFDSTNWSSVFTFTTLPTCPAPNNLSVSNKTMVSADLSWVPVLNDTLWQIEWDTAGFTQGNGNLVVTTNNPYTLNGLTIFTNYEFYVRALCDITLGDTSYWSGPYAFTTLDSCYKPKNLSVGSWGSDFADLTWTPGGSEAGWEIEWDTTNFIQGNGNYVLTLNDPYTLSGLNPNTQYDFYVRAICDSAYTSVWVGPQTFTTLIVGVNKVQDLSAVNIYPNPSNGVFNILMLGTSDVLTLTVANIQGQIVYKEQLSGIKYGTVSVLNLSSLAKGIYHITLNDSKTIINRKLIIN